MSVDLTIYETLKEIGINLLLTLPDKMVEGLLNLITEKKEIKEIPITREEEGIGIAAGAHLGGMKAAIIMQNSGLGNSINAIKSLLQLYKIPILLIVSHRGMKMEKINAQIPMGQITLKLLECIGVRTFVIKSSRDINKFESAIKYSEASNEPVAIILERSLWSEDY